jgi:hypothetical protein
MSCQTLRPSHRGAAYITLLRKKDYAFVQRVQKVLRPSGKLLGRTEPFFTQA